MSKIIWLVFDFCCVCALATHTEWKVVKYNGNICDYVYIYKHEKKLNTTGKLITKIEKRNKKYLFLLISSCANAFQVKWILLQTQGYYVFY